MAPERRLRSPTSVYADGSGKESPSRRPGKNVDDVWSRVWLNNDPSTWLLQVRIMLPFGPDATGSIDA